MVPILVLTFLAFFVASALIGISVFFSSQNKHSAVKKSPYECGVPSEENTSKEISVKFYLTAILFIIFDIEIIFLYPFAIAYRDFLVSPEGIYAILGMVLFLALFIFGLWWEIQSNALKWHNKS